MSKTVTMPIEEYNEMKNGYKAEMVRKEEALKTLHDTEDKFFALIDNGVFIKVDYRFDAFPFPFTRSGVVDMVDEIKNHIETNKDCATDAKQAFLDFFERELAMIEREFNKLKSESRKNMTFTERLIFLFKG